ncbi:hypothetical protein [Spiroplasma endosymbiont of Dasysyrphus albostriatus]|uniref:hypothetical protein n=1 Tax=Spiroplasma endosymbiont of Dasysyrphus albostriatus TaxID=3066299 RepID=UPI0030D473F0
MQELFKLHIIILHYLWVNITFVSYKFKKLSNLFLSITNRVKYLPYSPLPNVQSAGINDGILLLSNSLVMDSQLNWLSSNFNNSFWLMSGWGHLALFTRPLI